MARSRRERLRDLGGDRFPEVAVALVLLLAFLFFRLRIDTFVARARGRTFLAPDFWPGAILTFAIIMSVVYLVQAARRWRGAQALLPAAGPLAGAEEEAASRTSAATQADEPVDKQRWRRLAAGFALLFAYIYIMPTTGFVPATILFCAVFLLAVGERRWWLLALLPPAVAVLVLGIFTRLLVVPLPRGRGIFLELSTYLY